MQKLKSEKFEWIFIWVLIILPIIIGAIYIYSFAVNVPYWDQWEFIPNIEKSFYGKLSIFDFFAQQNESRPFFSSILMFVLALATDYNTIAETLFLYILYVTAFIIIFLMYKKDHIIDKISLIKFIPISWFFFNLFQMKNLLFGVRIAQSLEILALLYTIYFLDSSKTLNKRFFGATISATVSMFSFVSGLLTWPVGLIQIVLSDSKEKMRKIFIWIICGGLVFTTYFYGYIKPGKHPSLLYSLYNPSEAVNIFLSSIGSSVTRDLLSAQIIGILILVVTCCIILLNRKNLNLDKNAKWLSLIIYSLIVSVEITIARSGFEDPYYGMSERYLLLTFFSMIGLYCISLNTLKTSDETHNEDMQNVQNFNYLFFGIILCLIILGMSVFFVMGIEQGVTTKQSREEIAYYLETYKIQSDGNLQKLYPDLSVVRERSLFLDRHKLSVFSKKNIDIDTLTRLKSDTLYHVDTINGQIIDQKESITINKEKDNETRIIGWAVDLPADALADTVFVTIDNKMNIPAIYFIERKDVSETFQNNHFRYSGFMASFASNVIDTGNHTATIKIVTAGKTGYYESIQKINISVT